MIISSLQEFYSLCKMHKPILGIDYGNKKIGLAISTPEHTISMPHSRIFARTKQEQLTKIIAFVLKYDICAIVVGLPINMDGTNGQQVKVLISFINKLVTRITLPIYLQDERLTSKAADSLLKIMGFNRRQRNKKDDMPAASMILETMLESIKKLNLS